MNREEVNQNKTSNDVESQIDLEDPINLDVQDNYDDYTQEFNSSLMRKNNRRKNIVE